MGGAGIKMVNLMFNLLPYALQYVSMFMMVEMLVMYACQLEGVFVPNAEPGKFPEGVNGTRYLIEQGMFDCEEDWRLVVALVMLLVIFVCLSYQIWAMFRQTRHCDFGGFDYMCYLEVSKEKGSWFYKGLWVQVGIIIAVAVAVIVVALVILVRNGGEPLDYGQVLIKVGVRVALGVSKVPEMVSYDGPVNGKAHARMAWKVFPGMDLSYGWKAESKNFMVQLNALLSADPVVMEQIMVEATYMGQLEDDSALGALGLGDDPEEGGKADRLAKVQWLLDEGLAQAELRRVTLPASAGGRLGGGLGHIDATLLASLGQGDPTLAGGSRGDHGEDPRAVVSWAAGLGGGEQFPLDAHPRAAAAQNRFRELLWYFRDPHARQGLQGGEDEYGGPPEEPKKKKKEGKEEGKKEKESAERGDGRTPPNPLPPRGAQRAPAARGGAGAAKGAVAVPPAPARPPTPPPAAAHPPAAHGGGGTALHIRTTPSAPSAAPDRCNVEVLWTDGRRYPGSVLRRDAQEGCCTVWWEDGNWCENVPRSRIRYV